MPRAALRNVDGEVTVAVPRSYLERTGLGPSAAVEWDIEGDCLILRPAGRPSHPRLSLDDVLAECDQAAAPSDDDAAWTGGGPVGRELI